MTLIIWINTDVILSEAEGSNKTHGAMFAQFHLDHFPDIKKMVGSL
jgi:hypothetical protein